MKGMESWSELYDMRIAVSRQLGGVWQVPIVKKPLDRLLANINNGTRVLEIGAGDRRYEAMIRKSRPDFYYKGLDIDKKTGQDYYRLEDVNEVFDFVFMFEVIEHLDIVEGLELLKQIRCKLAPGGKILLSTPNLYHPHQYFRDSTHRTFFTFEELGGLMMMAGFKDIRAFRVYNDAWLRRMFRLYVGVHLHKYLNIDFAYTVLLEGGNP